MSSNLVNKVWFLLVFISGAIALWFCSLAIMGSWNYLRLAGKTTALVDTWEVQEINSSRFQVLAHYSYQVLEKSYQGQTFFKEPSYHNRPSAEADIQKLKDFEWDVWFDPKHPEVSSLQRIFPFKDCIYGLLTLGVFIYFLILRYFTFSKSMWKNDL